jgi:hypothetical protein
MRNILFIVAVATAFTVLAVASTQNEPVSPQPEKSGMSMMQNCPMKVPGADLSVANVENGVTLTITTKSGDVAELRRRTESMAKMHSASSATEAHGSMMAFSIKYEEVTNGARLTLTPKDLAQLEEFRAKVRLHAAQMLKGDCSMMQGMMQGKMGGMKVPEPAPEPEVKPNADDTDHNAHHPPGEKNESPDSNSP